MASVTRHNTLQVARSFQWVLSRLHRTKYILDKPLCIAQALLLVLKMVCQTVCRAQFSTLWRFKVFIWSDFRCWILIVHSFDRSTTNKRATARFHVDFAIAKVGKTDSPQFSLNFVLFCSEKVTSTFFRDYRFSPLHRCRNNAIGGFDFQTFHTDKSTKHNQGFQTHAHSECADGYRNFANFFCTNVKVTISL